MRYDKPLRILSLVALVIALGAIPITAQVLQVQCPTTPGGAPPADLDGDGILRSYTLVGGVSEIPNALRPRQVCMHITSGDGFIGLTNFITVPGETTPRRKPMYTFGFSNVTNVPLSDVLTVGKLAATFPAPTISLEEGDELYLSVSNVTLVARPDLFDPHSVHMHGIPDNSAVFDGLPESALTINPNSTITYYHKLWEPGTYMFHCHVEALEHMQMGMMGRIFVRAAQNRVAPGTVLGAYTHQAGDRYAYDDGDGSTRYDVEFPIQIHSMDSVFHDLHIAVQPLLGFPFWRMKDDYAMFNGRGYPDTVNTGILPGPVENGEKPSQTQNALITATAGQKVLLRVSNLNVTRDYTLATNGLPMRVVGKDAKLLRGTAGRSLAYTANTIFVASGSTYDVIIDTTGVAPGRYFLYTTNLNYLSNGTEDFGGLMTEIIIN